MGSSYIITEPAPSTTSYIRSGRGGAGNTFRASSPTTRSSSTTSSSHNQQPRRFFSGVGGAGNAHEASERPAVSLDDEVRRMAAREEHAARLGHCGIGGAGNVYRRSGSDASDSSASSISSQTSKSKLWARVTGKA